MRQGKRARKRIRMLFYIPFWILIISMFGGLIILQLSSYMAYRQELDGLLAMLEEEQQVAVDLRHRQAFYESDAYIEMLARERLGFVRQDEIVFRNIVE